MNQMSFGNEESFLTAPPIVNANEPHMACLFLLDTSGSMGANMGGCIPIDELNKAINSFKDAVCEDRKTREILDIAIVEFNSEVSVIQDFSPVEFMRSVQLSAGGGTYMAPAIQTAIDMVNDRSRFYRCMGSEPYKPWIVMISDGEPLDDISGISIALNDMVSKNKLAFWSLSLPGADNAVLHQLSGPRVLNLINYNFAGFFDWVNKSMRAVSESAPGEKPKLPAQIEGATLDSLG